MQNFFPADVSLRVSGEIGAAQKLFPAAKQLLFRALTMQQNGSPIVRLMMPGNDGSLIHVFLSLGLKHVYVQPGPVRKPVIKVLEEEEVKPLITTSCPNMLSGVVQPGTPVVISVDAVTGEETYAAHEFHPTQANANVYGLDFAWQDVERLGVKLDPALSTGAVLQVRWPKPSMYSGAMKRVVQAIYGIGKTTESGKDVTAQNHYNYFWDHTDGIRKVGASYWLVRISKIDGVLAMPLPLFECTTGEGFRSALASIGDVDTYSVVNEFGGLPSGETFPVNHPDASPPTFARDEAIAAGKLLRLLTKEEMEPFYKNGVQDKLGMYGACGWAFSESGANTDAHNTCFWYSNEGFATAWHNTHSTFELLEADATKTPSSVAPLEDRAMRAEHWKVEVVLSEINRAPALNEPVGTGIATLSQVEASLLAGPRKVSSAEQVSVYPWWSSHDEMLRVPEGGVTDKLRFIVYWGRPPNYPPSAVREYKNLDCPITVFYIGEVPEIIRHQPEYIYASGFVGGTQIDRLGSATGGTGEIPGNPSVETITPFEPGADPPGYYTDTVNHQRQSHEYAGLWAWRQDYHFNVHCIVIIPTGGGCFAPTDFSAEALSGPFWRTDQGVPPVQRFNVEGELYDADYSLPSFSTIITGGLTYPVAPFSWTRRWSLTWKRSGAFYSTSFDPREDRRYGVQTNENTTTDLEILDHAENWELSVGLVIPAGAREAALFAKWKGGVNVTSVYPVAQVPFPVVVEHRLLARGLGVGAITGPTLDPISAFQWSKIINAFNFRYAASINAGPTECGIVQDGIYADIILPGLLNEKMTSDPTYVGSAGGIPVTDVAAIDATFVGAV